MIGTWKNGMPWLLTSSALLVWFEMTSDDVGGQVAGAMLPQQLEQGVLGARDEDRQPFAARGVGQAPLHAVAAGDRLEGLLQGRAAAWPGPGGGTRRA